MVSELQRVARGLVECLDEAPGVVAHLQRTAARCRENAGVVIDASHGEATVAALQLDAAARACEEAAHYLAMAPPQAKGWAERLIGSSGRTSRASAGSAKRNRATGGTEDLDERRGESIGADLDIDRNDAPKVDRRADDKELAEAERRLVARGNEPRPAELRYEPEAPIEAPEPIELPDLEVELADLAQREEEPPPVLIEVEPFELAGPEGERSGEEEEQPPPVPIEVEPFELAGREDRRSREEEEQPPPVPIEVEPFEVPDDESGRFREEEQRPPAPIEVAPFEEFDDGGERSSDAERPPRTPIQVEPIEVPEISVDQPEPEDPPEPIEVDVWPHGVPAPDPPPPEQR